MTYILIFPLLGIEILCSNLLLLGYIFYNKAEHKHNRTRDTAGV